MLTGNLLWLTKEKIKLKILISKILKKISTKIIMFYIIKIIKIIKIMIYNIIINNIIIKINLIINSKKNKI